MPLTDAALRNARPADKQFKIFDGEGLHILIMPKGSKLWRLKYRFDGREKLLALGAYPSVSLRDARTAKDEAKAAIARGRDPADARRQAKVAKAMETAQTFSAIAAELLAKMTKEGRAASTLLKAEWLLRMANKSLGNRPIRDISAREVLRALKAVEARGNYETAKRLRSIISRVFRYAVATDRADIDPTFALRGALIRPEPTPRAAITDLVGARKLFRAICAYPGQPTTRAALQLAAILVPRPGELRQARWDEFDTENAVWTIPAERMKMRRPHRIPLPRAALEVLDGLRPFTGWCDFVVPSIRSPRRPLSENTMNTALRTLGYGKDEMTSHGFRAMFSSIANESGLWNPDAIERALAHVDSNAVRRAYARGEHWEERVKLAGWWAEQLQPCG